MSEEKHEYPVETRDDEHVGCPGDERAAGSEADVYEEPLEPEGPDPEGEFADDEEPIEEPIPEEIPEDEDA